MSRWLFVGWLTLAAVRTPLVLVVGFLGLSVTRACAAGVTLRVSSQGQYIDVYAAKFPKAIDDLQMAHERGTILASEAAVYSARLLSASQACSGPIDG